VNCKIVFAVENGTGRYVVLDACGFGIEEYDFWNNRDSLKFLSVEFDGEIIKDISHLIEFDSGLYIFEGKMIPVELYPSFSDSRYEDIEVTVIGLDGILRFPSKEKDEKFLEWLFWCD
jgi:hypothetical protein